MIRCSVLVLWMDLTTTNLIQNRRWANTVKNSDQEFEGRNSVPEAKVLLINLVEQLSKIQYPHICEPSILTSVMVAIEQGGPGSAFLGLLDNLQSLWPNPWYLCNRDIDPLLLWYAEYFLSKKDEGYSNQWLQSQHHDEIGQSIDLPQIISLIMSLCSSISLQDSASSRCL